MTNLDVLAAKSLDVGLADSNLPEDVKNTIRQISEPAICFDLMAEPAPATLGTSRAGGLPDLPKSVSWPRVTDWSAPVFALQINLTDLPKNNRLPNHGLLSLFVYDECGYDHHFLYTEDLSDLERKAWPADMSLPFDLDDMYVSPTEVDDNIRTLRDCKIKFYAKCSWDEYALEETLPHTLSTEQSNILYALNGHPNQILGVCTAIHDRSLSWVGRYAATNEPIPDKRTDGPEDPSAWEIFMTLWSNSEAAMNWHGDSHALIIAIPTEDLDARNFERTYSTIDG